MVNFIYMKIYKKISTISFLSLLCITDIINNAKGIQITDYAYGHFNVFTGLTLQKMNLEVGKEKFSGRDLKSNLNSAILVGLGYNVYFSIHEFYHPFMGLDLQGRIPFKGSNYLDNNTEYSNETAYKHYQEIFMAHLKVGSKLNISDIFAVSPYGLFGFNLGNMRTDVMDLHKEKTYINYSFGFGCDVMIFNRFIFALEYRYAGTRQDNITNINHHNVSAKFGIELF